MKKTPALNELTREVLLNDLINLINQQNEIAMKLQLNELDCQIDYYYFELITLEQKNLMIQEILINNKF
jgi:hypothetical protein